MNKVKITNTYKCRKGVELFRRSLIKLATYTVDPYYMAFYYVNICSYELISILSNLQFPILFPT